MDSGGRPFQADVNVTAWKGRPTHIVKNDGPLIFCGRVGNRDFQRLNDVFEGANLVGSMSSFGLDQEGRLLILNYSGNLNRLEDQR